MFFFIDNSNPTSENERNKESNDSYKSHPQQSLGMVLWVEIKAHSNWSGYVGCVIRQAQHGILPFMLTMRG